MYQDSDSGWDEESQEPVKPEDKEPVVENGIDTLSAIHAAPPQVWTDLMNSMEYTVRFVAAFNSPAVLNYVKYIDDPLMEKSLLTVSIPLLATVDLDDLVLEPINAKFGTARVAHKDSSIFQNVPGYLIPFYTIDGYHSPIMEEKSSSSSCIDCTSPINPDETDSVYCSLCGVSLCISCAKQCKLLHRGFDEKKEVCSGCFENAHKINAEMWLKQAILSLREYGEPTTARMFIQIGSQYFQFLKHKKSILPIFHQIQNLSLELHDFKTFLVILVAVGTTGFDWDIEAHKLCEMGEVAYSFAMFCLKSIDVGWGCGECPELRQKWETLGDKMGHYHSDLAMFCYTQCEFGSSNWIEKAKYYDTLANKEGSNENKVFFKIIRECLQLVNPSTVKKVVDELFTEGRCRLSLYCIKVHKFKVVEVLNLVRKWYNASVPDNRVVVALIKYLMVTENDQQGFARLMMVSLWKDDPAVMLACNLRILFDEDLSYILEVLNAETNFTFEHLLIPLALSKYKSLLSWEQLVIVATAGGFFHARSILKKYADAEQKRMEDDWGVEIVKVHSYDEKWTLIEPGNG